MQDPTVRRRPSPLTDPTRRPPDLVAVYCTGCGAWLMWCSPPAPSCRVHCHDCRDRL